MTARKTKPRKPKLGRVWSVYGVVLSTEGATLEIYTPGTWNGVPCAIAYPDEARKLATKLNQFAAWAEAKERK